MQTSDETTPEPRSEDRTEEILYGRGYESTPSVPPPPETARPLSPPRRSSAGPLLAAAFVASTVIGGLFGGFAGAELLAPRVQPSATPAIESETPVTPSGVAQTTGATVASQVYEAVKDGVVHIVVVGGGAGRGNGSGFIVDDRGYILTNFHVVEGARAVTVRFANNETASARVVGTDRQNDLALLLVELPAGTKVLTLGDSSTVQVGETAIAIGSPFGLAQSVTQGIVSAVDRSWQPSNSAIRERLIQTDAPINPGNSGGPLLNARGEVIGINAMIESPVEGSVGVGFAISINVAKERMPQLQTGAVSGEPVWLGIRGLALDETIASDLDLSVSEGVLVTEAIEGGPAADAGIRGGDPDTGDIPIGGDIILELNGSAVSSVQQLSSGLQTHKPGDRVTLTILRNGERQQVTVTLEPWPTQQP